MTVLEVLGSCVQRINGIRLPVAEAANMLQLAGVAGDIQACINTLAAHANDSAAPAEDAEQAEMPDAEPEAVAAAPEEDPDARPTDDAEDLFGEKEQEGGGRG